MYCPVCFNDSLTILNRGLIHVIINGKQLDTGRFLFNLERHNPEMLYQEFESQCDRFFKWYSSFQNVEPIYYVELLSCDFRCSSGCKIDLKNRFSIINHLIPEEIVLDILERMSSKHNMALELKY